MVGVTSWRELFNLSAYFLFLDIDIESPSIDDDDDDELSLAQEPRSGIRLGLSLSLLREVMVLVVSFSSTASPTPGTALSADVLNFLNSLKISVQPFPSSLLCLSSSLLSYLAIRSCDRRDTLLFPSKPAPSLPVPSSTPAFFRASVILAPVFASAALSGFNIFSFFSASVLFDAPPHLFTFLHLPTPSTLSSWAF